MMNIFDLDLPLFNEVLEHPWCHSEPNITYKCSLVTQDYIAVHEQMESRTKCAILSMGYERYSNLFSLPLEVRTNYFRLDKLIFRAWVDSNIESWTVTLVDFSKSTDNFLGLLSCALRNWNVNDLLMFGFRAKSDRLFEGLQCWWFEGIFVHYWVVQN